MNKSFANSLTALSIAALAMVTLAFFSQPVEALADHHEPVPAVVQNLLDDTNNVTADDANSPSWTKEKDELARRAMIRAGTGLHFFSSRLYGSRWNR